MRTLRVLVVDDSRVARNMIMEAIRRTELADFEFMEAADGADALTRYDLESIDVIFLDWNMPNMTGVEFAKHVRDNYTSCRAPIIMVTSERTLGKMQEALDQAGVQAYITKPFTVDMIKVKLEKAISEMQPTNKPNNERRGFFRSKLFKS